MSITSPDDRLTTYQPVTPTMEFAADFPIFNNDDLKVVVDGEERDDFVVSATYVQGISNDAKAVFGTGVTGLVQIVGSREPRRTNRFLNGGPLPVWAVNLALDTIEAEMQEAAREASRAHRAPIGEGGGVFSAEDIGHAQEYAEVALEARDETLQLKNDAVDAADRAESAASGLNLPSLNSGQAKKLLVVKTDGSGYEFSALSGQRADLKAVNTEINQRFFLDEIGREGWFYWRSGDFSTVVSVDTSEAIYIKADAVAASVGAWVRVYDGQNINTRWTGGNWQAAIDLAATLSIPTVTPTEDMTLTVSTGPLMMRPGVTVHNFAGNVKLSQTNAAQLSTMVDFNTNNAAGAKLIGIIVDGNRANNNDDPAITVVKSLILIFNASDVTVQRCTLRNSVGNGVYIHQASRAIIDANVFSNIFGGPICILPTTAKGDYAHKITNNVISGGWGQHAIVARWANFCVIKGNKITGYSFAYATGVMLANASGTTVTSTSGNWFTPASVGKFLIINGGTEKLIVGYTSPTVVTVNSSLGTLTGVPAVWGNGDVISIQGADDCDISDNDVIISASLGISIFSDGVQSASRNRVVNNRVGNHGSAGISIQNVAGTFVSATLIQSNVVTECGMNKTAADNSYNVGIAVRGGANTQRVSVVSNLIEGYAVPATMDYGIAFDAAVVAKTYTANTINGTIGGKLIQNP